MSVRKTLGSEAVDMPCVVNVLITDDAGIRRYNRTFRQIDKTTDVLSFPMQVFSQAGWGNCEEIEIDESTGSLPLGDILLSSESVRRQAFEYGNSIEHETVYLTVHSTLHLLGYDHDTGVSEKIMHEKNEQIIQETGILSNGK